MPDAFSFSANFGRMPVGVNVPSTRAILSDSLLLENENILHADHVVFHAGDLGQMSHAPGSVVEARNLDDQRHCGSNLAPDRFFGKFRFAIMAMVSIRAIASRGPLA